METVFKIERGCWLNPDTNNDGEYEVEQISIRTHNLIKIQNVTLTRLIKSTTGPRIDNGRILVRTRSPEYFDSIRTGYELKIYGKCSGQN